MLAVLLVCARAGDRVVPGLLRASGPEARTNYGELIAPPRPLPARLPLTDLRRRAGRAAARCTASGCSSSSPAAPATRSASSHLWLQRQLRETLGREKDRVDKLWLVDDGARRAPRRCGDRAPRARARCAGDRAARRPRGAGRLARAGAGHALEDHLYIVDPLRRLDDARAGRRRSGAAEARRRQAAARLGRLGPGRAMSDAAGRYDLRAARRHRARSALALALGAAGLVLARAPPRRAGAARCVR